jgi:hypothetical protein
VTAAATLAALYTLVVAAAWWLAANLAFAVIASRAGAARGRLTRPWLAAQGLIAIAWLPTLAAVYGADDGDPLRGYRWIPPTTWNHLRDVLSSVYLYRVADVTSFSLLPTAVPGLGFAAVAFALVGIWRMRAEPQRLTPVVLAWLAMPLVLLAASAVHAFWVPRYLLWSTGPFFILAGVGIAALPLRIFAPALAAFVIAAGFNIAPYYTTETKPRWDLAADYLASHGRQGDSVVGGGYYAMYVLAAFAERARLETPVIDGANIARTAAALPKDGQVWLLYGRTGQSPALPSDEYLRLWSVLGPPAETLQFGRSVTAWRFAPRAR